MLKGSDGVVGKLAEDEISMNELLFLCADYLDLILIQRDLEISLGGEFVGSSLTSTLYRCLLLGAHQRAKQIRMDFQVPNKRWWWLKIRALAATERWDLLQAFSKQESPIGFLPFAEVYSSSRVRISILIL